MKDSALVQDLVFLDNREAFTDSLIVARVFNKAHNNVLKDIRKVSSEIASFGGLVETYKEEKLKRRLIGRRLVS